MNCTYVGFCQVKNTQIELVVWLVFLNYFGNWWVDQ